MTQSIFTCITRWVSKGKAFNLKCPKYKDFYTILLILILVGLVNSKSYCQAPQADRLNNIIPASPTVTAFQKYIDYPVSHTTGIPDISIPIYQINSGSLSLPISLSYHSSGLKVDEQTGTVGLGWVLNAGGTVSRKIVNQPDEFAPYPYPYRDPYYLDQNIEADFNYIANLHKAGGNTYPIPDAEYDVYYYTVGGTSGRFFLASDGVNKRKVVTIPYEPILIKSSNGDFSPYGPAIDYFEITDKNGVIYRFGKSSTNATDAIEKNADNTTAWFIKEIYSADHSSFIKFTYGSYLRTDKHRSEMWEVTELTNKFSVFCCSGLPEEFCCNNQQNSLNDKIEQRQIEHTDVDYFTPFITDIEFTGGTIHFDYAGNLFNSDKRLKKITVKNGMGSVVKITDLEQSPASTGGMLELLSSLKSKDALNNTNEIYNFYYNPETISGSGPNSNAVDYWGYFNGQTANASLIPPFQLPNNYGGYNTTSYNNRSPNEDAAKTFMLNKIKYPTGGTTEFSYELNRANNVNIGGLRIKSITSKASETDRPMRRKYFYGEAENGNGILLNDADIHSFLIASEYDYSCTNVPKHYCGNGGPLGLVDAKFRVRTISSDLNDGGGLNSGAPVFYDHVTEYQEGEYNPSLGTNNLNGKTVFVYEPPILHNELIGTARSKNRYDEWKTNHLISRTDFVKTGTNYIPLKIEENEYYIRSEEDLKCTKVVLKKWGSSGGGGLWSLYNPTVDAITRMYSLWNLYPGSDGYVTARWWYGEVYNIQEYRYATGVKILNKKKVTEYTSSGNIVTTENYTYGTDHNEPLTITTTNSKGETQIVTNKYPHDFISQQPYTDMVNVKHIWAPIVEQSIFKDNISNLLKSTKINFGFWNGSAWTTASTNQILPQTVEEKIKNNNSETRIMFNKYDVKNNLLEQQKKDDVKEVYLWGYNSQYPVAKVVGSDYTTVSQVISQIQVDAAIATGDDNAIRSALNVLRTNPMTSSAFVTTYTYKPLVGITSETDSNGKTIYYTYDAFGRLVAIIDKDNNVIKKICYNYAGQVENCNTPTFTNDQQQATFTRTTACAAGLVLPTSTYTVPAGTYSSYIDKATANQLAINAMNTNGQAAANALPCLAPFSGWNKTSQPWNVTVTNTAGTFNATYSFYPGSAASLFANIPVGTYNLSLAPMNAGSVTSPVQLVLNGTTYTGTSFNVTNAGINAATTLTLQNTPSAPGPCTFEASPGIGTPSYSFNNNGTTVSFYIVFYSSSEMLQGITYQLGTVSAGCRPSSQQSFSINTNGATWILNINPSGQVLATLIYGASSFPPYSTRGSGSTLTYNL